MSGTWIRRGAWTLGLALVAAFVVWSLLPGPVAVDVATVSRGAFRKTVDEDGKTRVRDRYVVSAPLAGRLLRITLDAGDRVTPGTPLAVLVPAAPALLDARTEEEQRERVGAAEARLMSAAATVERARVALELARSDLARMRTLGAQGFMSGQAVERSERDVELRVKELSVAQFGQQAAEHELAMARAALSRLHQDAGRRAAGSQWEIRSPVAGRVLRVLQESEAVVPVGAALLEIGDPDALEVVVDVLTTDAESIRPDAAVVLERGAAGPPLAGRVRRVEPAAFTKVSALGIEEQRVNVVIDLVSPHEQWDNLGDGYRLDARIAVEAQDDAVLVPVSALFRHDGGWAVYRVVDGRARLAAVRIGARSQVEAVVDDGLEPGNEVIVYPGDAVRDGARVTRRPASAVSQRSRPSSSIRRDAPSTAAVPRGVAALGSRDFDRPAYSLPATSR